MPFGIYQFEVKSKLGRSWWKDHTQVPHPLYPIRPERPFDSLSVLGGLQILTLALPAHHFLPLSTLYGATLLIQRACIPWPSTCSCHPSLCSTYPLTMNSGDDWRFEFTWLSVVYNLPYRLPSFDAVLLLPYSPVRPVTICVYITIPDYDISLVSSPYPYHVLSSFLAYTAYLAVPWTNYYYYISSCSSVAKTNPITLPSHSIFHLQSNGPTAY